MYICSMAGNSFGTAFRITTFGESHGPALGVVIDGCPPGLQINARDIQAELDRRAPGKSKYTTTRKEPDKAQILSGIHEGITLGSPICIMLTNRDARPDDYKKLKNIFRPSHADYVYQQKYGIRDHRGGGRASARETAARVAAGAIAMKILEPAGIRIFAFVDQIGHLKLAKSRQKIDLKYNIEHPLNIPDDELAAKAASLIESIKAQGDSIGGSICCIIKNCPVGLGEPVFDKLQADLAKAMMSINAAKGFEIGSGFGAVNMRGSEHNDTFYKDGDTIKTRTNHSGGIQAGISNGMDIYFRVAFKPVSTIKIEQESLDAQGNTVRFVADGRHDPCVVPRAVPIVEAMTRLVLADHFLRYQSIKPE